jgi:hypothetical protein
MNRIKLNPTGFQMNPVNHVNPVENVLRRTGPYNGKY